MTAFQCVAIATDIAERFRTTGKDDNGNALRRMEATDGGSFPCRHCLCFAQPGETVVLGSYNLTRPRGIYWTPSPIFVHAAPCLRFSAVNVVAPIIREGALVSVRAYDAADQCVYDLGQVCAGVNVDAPLQRAMSDERTAFVNVHTARPGCLLSHVERHPEAQSLTPMTAVQARGATEASIPSKIFATCGTAWRRRRERDHLAGLDWHSRNDLGRHRITAELSGSPHREP